MHRRAGIMLIATAVTMSFTGCHSGKDAQDDAPTPSVTSIGGGDSVTVSASERFSLVTTSQQMLGNSISVTGSVNPDVSREIPVLSMANGRVTKLDVGLGDTVHKGQLVMEVQSPDAATAFNTYTKAVNDEHLTNVTLTRDKLLYDKGAIPKSQLEAAQTGEDDAKADLAASLAQLRVLGVDKNHPGELVRVYAPATGVIISQNTTAAGAAGANLAGTNGSFTIADLTHVWVICDVYENDLAKVKLGDAAEIRLNAYPGRIFDGTVSNIGAVLDPTIRTAKVRIQVPNPGGLLRVGEFATATLKVASAVAQTTVPATAVLHLHDRDYVFVPSGNGVFRRVTVQVGQTLPGGLVTVQSGLAVGERVVANALELQNTADQA